MTEKNRTQKWMETKGRMNRAIGTYAHLTRFIPKGPRQKVRDWLIDKTSIQPVEPPKPYRKGKFPYGINEYGFFREENGLGQGARMYARSIEAAGIPHRFIHLNFLTWMPQHETSFDGKLDPKPAYAVNLIHLNPDQWEEAMRNYPKGSFDKRYNIGIWLWELETLPRGWLKYLDYVDELWVPSEFIAGAARKETAKPVTVIPYGMEVTRAELTRADFDLPEETFIALSMYDSNSYVHRKNPMAAIEAFTEAFSGNSNAMLIVKINHPKEAETAQIEDQLKKAGVQYRLIQERMEREELNALIACCDAFISLHRSEGFGLPIAEAMALGTPAVATNWSANAEFMSGEGACPVGYTLVPVGDRYKDAEEGQVWAEPDIHEAAGYLQKLYEDPGYREGVAAAGQAHVRTTLSIEKSGKMMKKRLDEILCK